MSSNSSSDSQEGFLNRHHDKWLRKHEEDVGELRSALSRRADEHELQRLIDKSIEGFRSYIERRREMARVDVVAVFNPQWCSGLENSIMWIAGCRPTMGIRLVYALSGVQIEENLQEFLRGIRRGDLSELSAAQLARIDDLHLRTIREEDRLTKRMTMLQEELADIPLVKIIMRYHGAGDEAAETIDSYLSRLRSIMEDADQLRIVTVTELLAILTPLQAVEFLVAMKQLHLAIHRWGIEKDRERASPTNGLVDQPKP